MKQQINRDEILKTLKKMVSNTTLVHSFIKGKTTLAELTQKGIKFGKPL